MTVETYRGVLERRFGGVLLRGQHTEDGQACALEVASVVRGVVWTDDPRTVGLPDLRALNDAAWSTDAMRTEHMVPVIEALWDWSAWTDERRRRVVARVAERTIREILPIVLRQAGLNDEANRCAEEGTADAADAAYAAARAADDDLLITSCRIWIESAAEAV